MRFIETHDIFRSAFLLCTGGTLSETRLVGPKQIVFVISGEEVEDQDFQYRNGHALVNPLDLRKSLNLLRDLVFEMRGERNRHGRQSRRA